MYVRMVKTRTRSGKKTHCYLRVVESYRSNGKVRQRVLWNMGKWERVHPGLTGLVKSLSRFSREQFLTVREIKDKQAREYGNILLLKRLWEGSGFKKTLESSFGAKVRRRRFALSMTDCIMAMVFHRLCQPTTYSSGATALSSWLSRVYLPEAERLARLGPGRLRKRLVSSVDFLGRLEWPKGQKALPSGKNCIIEISPVSSGGKRYGSDYLAALPLGHNNLSWCKVYTRKELSTLLQELKGTKRILIARYSALGREGVAFLDKESIPYLAFLRKGRTTRRRSRKRYLTFKYGNQRVCLRTNVARVTSLHKARRALKGLLETETALGYPSLPSFVPRAKAYLKGYIFVCVLAHLSNRILQEGLSRQGIGVQPAEVLDTLKEIRIVSNLLAGRRWDYLSGMTRQRRALLKTFGIKRPSALGGQL